ncbi:MAG TPA: GNAT family N-acetyltransferase [Proteiniclasticum sp.]|nr:GNAT family N-acetyltransferase [Proteiniclasticum sp.]
MFIAETERLLLRTLELEDIDPLMGIWGDDAVMKYSGGAGTREREIRALEFYLKLQEEEGYSPYAVIMKENSEVIGVCGFNPPDDEHIELMYHFSRKHWGKGFATESTIACIDYARKHLKSEKLVAFTDPQNKGSENVLLKSGFSFKGIKWHGGSKKEEHYFELTLQEIHVLDNKRA